MRESRRKRAGGDGEMGGWGENQIDGTEEGQRREGAKEGGDEGRCDAGFGLYERFKNETF